MLAEIKELSSQENDFACLDISFILAIRVGLCPSELRFPQQVVKIQQC